MASMPLPVSSLRLEVKLLEESPNSTHRKSCPFPSSQLFSIICLGLRQFNCSFLTWDACTSVLRVYYVIPFFSNFATLDWRCLRRKRKKLQDAAKKPETMCESLGEIGRYERNCFRAENRGRKEGKMAESKPEVRGISGCARPLLLSKSESRAMHYDLPFTRPPI